jgi:hypothetical protein
MKALREGEYELRHIPEEVMNCWKRGIKAAPRPGHSLLLIPRNNSIDPVHIQSTLSSLLHSPKQ